METPGFLNKLASWRPQRLARASLGMFGWLAFRALAQLALIVLLSRALGNVGYGVFVAVAATATLVLPLAGLGTQALLLRDASRDTSSAPELLRKAIKIWLASLSICLVISMALIEWLIPPYENASAWLLLLVMTSDISCLSMAEIAGRIEQAKGRFHRYGAIHALPVVARAMTAGALFSGMNDVSVQNWLLLYASIGFICCGFLLQYSIACSPKPKRALRPELSLKSGIPYVIGSLSLRLQGEYNKPLLARADFGSAGTFNVAQRATDVISLPLLALQEALWPRLYRAARLKDTLTPIAVLLVASFFAGGVILMTAPLLPLVFGQDFQQAIQVAKFLALIPFLQSLRALLGVLLTRDHRTTPIAYAYACGAASSVILTTIGVSNFGMNGAVLAIYCVEIIVTLILATAFIYGTEKRRRSIPSLRSPLHRKEQKPLRQPERSKKT